MSDETKHIEVTYKFFLPEHSREMYCIHQSDDMASTLWDIDQKCLDILKYNKETTAQDLADEIRWLIGVNVDLNKLWT